MTQGEVLKLLIDARQGTIEMQTDVWQQLQAEARGEADQLTLVDMVKLDGMLELLERVFWELCQHAPQLLPCYAPCFFAICSDDRGPNLLGRPYRLAEQTPLLDETI